MSCHSTVAQTLSRLVQGEVRLAWSRPGSPLGPQGRFEALDGCAVGRVRPWLGVSAGAGGDQRQPARRSPTGEWIDMVSP